MPRATRPRIKWKVIRLVIVIGLLIDLFWAWHMWNVYYETLPRVANPAIGRVFAENFHGITIYETRDERLRLQLLQYSSDGLIAVLLLAAALHQWKRTRTKLPSEPPPMG